MNASEKVKVHYYPPVSQTNRYVDCNLRIWKRLNLEAAPAPFYLRGILKMVSLRREQQVVLNWFEDRVNYAKRPMFECAISLAMLVALRCVFKKIHWVRHNFSGHDNGNTFARRVLEFALQCLSDTQITHRPIKGYSYIPHPLYPVTRDLEQHRDIPFLYFGVVKKYKNLEVLLQHWPKDVPLQMVGSCPDANLQNVLNNIIESRDLPVHWVQRYLEEEELNALLARAQCVVIPHRESSMVVSGAAYHALSYHAHLLVNHSDFADYLQSKWGSRVEVFSPDNLSQKIKAFSFEEKGLACGESREFSDEAIAEQWAPVLQTKTFHVAKKNRLTHNKLNGFER